MTLSECCLQLAHLRLFTLVALLLVLLAGCVMLWAAGSRK